MMSKLLISLFSIGVFAANSAWADDPVPTPHKVFKCTIDGNATDVIIFAYDQKGARGVGLSDVPGYCKLTNDASGNPFGSYFCWIGNTTTADTTDGKLGILFNDNLGDGAHLYNQLNVPKDISGISDFGGTKTFSGTHRLLSRSPQSLNAPIPARAAQKLDCKAVTLTFQDFPPRN